MRPTERILSALDEALWWLYGQIAGRRAPAPRPVEEPHLAAMRRARVVPPETAYEYVCRANREWAGMVTLRAVMARQVEASIPPASEQVAELERIWRAS